MEQLGNAGGRGAEANWETRTDKDDRETELVGGFRAIANEDDPIKRRLLVEELYTHADREGMPSGLVNDLYLAARKSLDNPDLLEDIEYEKIGGQDHQVWPQSYHSPGAQTV